MPPIRHYAAAAYDLPMIFDVAPIVSLFMHYAAADVATNNVLPCRRRLQNITAIFSDANTRRMPLPMLPPMPVAMLERHDAIVAAPCRRC